ncbi:unnamed protein product [Protopolystoma xenopodis]|uniref:Uncharacterized protein n=1 Tax=Protopolystoma xenopodis TaxID=117903 RepID=A0A3S5CUD3_9PLAT|nr:unnamed protein product [Protopolystoma xenopodis]
MECGPISFAIYPDPSLSIGLSNSGLQSGSLHCLMDPLPIFLVDRFHSVSVPVCIPQKALFLKAQEERTLPLPVKGRPDICKHGNRSLGALLSEAAVYVFLGPSEIAPGVECALGLEPSEIDQL